MARGVANFSGEKLTEARLARGLYKNALADMLGVTAMAITRYEANQDKPSFEKLDAIATILSFPRDFFTRRPWPDELGPIFWRSQAAETKHAREMSEQRMRWLCELFNILEEDLEFPSVSIPDMDIPTDFRTITSSMIEGYAEQLRAAWGLRDLPIRDVVLSLENAGIPVVMLNIASEKQDGFFFRSPSLQRPFIGINVHDVTAARARFDAAHELGHLVLHRNVTAQQERDKALHKLLEQQAHRFAGAFLFPRTQFIVEVGMPSLDYFSALKRRWGVSIAAMIARAFDLGLIDEYGRRQLYISMTRRKWRGAAREPFDDVMELEKPRMMRRAAEALLDSGDLTKEALRELMALPDRELEQLLGLENGSLTGGKITSLEFSSRSKPALEATDLESGQVLQFPARPVR